MNSITKEFTTTLLSSSLGRAGDCPLKNSLQELIQLHNGTHLIIPYHHTVDFSDPFSVTKMQLLGGYRLPQDLLASQRLAHVPWGGLWPPKRSWGGLWLPKSCFSLSGKVGTSKCHTRTFVTHYISSIQKEKKYIVWLVEYTADYFKFQKWL